MRKTLLTLAAMTVIAGVCLAEVDPYHRKDFRDFGLGRKKVTRIVAKESVTTSEIIPFTNGTINVGNVAFTNDASVAGDLTVTGDATITGGDINSGSTLDLNAGTVVVTNIFRVDGTSTLTGAAVMSSSVVVVDGITSTNGVLVGSNSNRVMRTSGNNVFQQVGFGTNGQLVTFLEPFASTPTALMVSPYGNWGLMITNGMGWSTLTATNFTLVTPSGVHTGHWVAVGAE